MASFGEGFAGGLGQGMAMGKMLMDTYNDANTKRRIKENNEQAPTEVSQLSDDQNASLQAIQNAKLDDGSNAFQVERTGTGGFKVRAAGDENAQWGDEIAPAAKKWKLGDKTYDTKPTESQVSQFRDQGLAKILMDNGDIKGAYAALNMGRENRKGTAIEDIGDQERAFLTDMASNGGQLSDKSKEVLTKAAGIYNQNQGRHNDGRILSYDFDKGEATFTDAKTGRIVDRQPINGKTATFVGGEYFNHLRGAIDPKFSLDLRGVQAKETSAGADVTKANAYASLVPSEISKNNAAAAHYGSGGSGGMSSKAFDAKINTVAKNMVDAGVIDPTTNKPITIEAARHQVSQTLIKSSEAAAPKVNADGSIVQGGNVYVPDPNNPGKYVQAQLPNGGQNPIVAAFANADPSKLNKGGSNAPAAKPESQLGLGQSLRIKAQGVDAEIARTTAALERAKRDAKASGSPEEWGDTISTYEKQLAALEAIKNKKGK